MAGHCALVAPDVVPIWLPDWPEPDPVRLALCERLLRCVVAEVEPVAVELSIELPEPAPAVPVVSVVVRPVFMVPVPMVPELVRPEVEPLELPLPPDPLPPELELPDPGVPVDDPLPVPTEPPLDPVEPPVPVDWADAAVAKLKAATEIAIV